MHLTDEQQLGAERLLYTLTGPELAPMTGVIDFKDGVADAMITGVPAGADRAITVELVARGATVCTLSADALSIDEGRSAQVELMGSACGTTPKNIDRALTRNTAPKITAVFASRSLAQFRETVAVAVSANDADGDPLTVLWSEQLPAFGFTNKTAPATGWVAGPFGVTNKLKVVVRDNRGGVAIATIKVDVEHGVTGDATCGEPSAIKIGERVRGLTIGGASELSPVSCGFGDPAVSEAPERVFRLVLTQPTTFSVSTVGSAFNAVAYVRRGLAHCDDGDTELGCRQTFELPQGLVFENAPAGQYFIVVDGLTRFDRGEFTLHVRAGDLPEDCLNGIDDDNDGNFDCADDECTGKPGCFECAFDCNPDPNDCFGGACDRFTGRCFAFPEFGTTCDADNNPTTPDACFDGLCQPSNAVCGNGLVEPSEQCDDGNVLPGDGCEPDCTITTCGGLSCNDGNQCTTDTCVDPVNGACSFDPIADGTPCEADFDPTTADSCQAGICVGAPPPRPDPALMVLDPIVLNDPAFSLAAMHDRLALDGNGAVLFEQWASTLAEPQTINADVAQPRFGFTNFVAALPRRADGTIDLAQAGFRASAFVNRIDLKKPGTCGESRVVYTKETGLSDGGNRMTLIFEFGVPDDGTNCRTISQRWAALRGLDGEALQAAAVQLMLDNSQRQLLNQFRTNEFVFAPFWELREFHLDLANGVLVPHAVADTPPFALQDDPAFREFVIANAAALNVGAHGGGVLPLEMLGAASNAGGQRFELGTLVPALPGLTGNFNIQTCSGCHLTETGTGFVHVAERSENQPSPLSLFLRSELDFRATVLAPFLAP